MPLFTVNRNQPPTTKTQQQIPAPETTAPVVFMHIAKTAGTSLVEYLRNRLPAGSVLSHGDFMDFPQQRISAQQASGYRLISGHFSYSHVAHFLADSYSLTFLRDPLSRVLSLYKFLLNKDMQKRFAVARTAAELPVDDFLTSTRPEVVEMLDNQQTWQLADSYWMAAREQQPPRSNAYMLELAKAHLQEFSLVGFTDTFAEDFRRVILAMGLPEPAHVPRQLRTADPLQHSQLKASTLATLQQRLALDYELLDFARQLRRYDQNWK